MAIYPQRLPNPLLIKPDDNLAFDIHYRHAHLAGFLHHQFSRLLVRGDIHIFKDNITSFQELFDLHTPLASGSAVNHDMLIHRLIPFIDNEHTSPNWMGECPLSALPADHLCPGVTLISPANPSIAGSGSAPGQSGHPLFLSRTPALPFSSLRKK